MIAKPARVESKALRNSARGQDCTVRSSDCNGDPATTVLAHLRGVWALGTATKPSDTFGVYACSACHDAMDGRKGDPFDVTPQDKLRALYETQAKMIAAGLIAVRK